MSTGRDGIRRPQHHPFFSFFLDFCFRFSLPHPSQCLRHSRESDRSSKVTVQSAAVHNTVLVQRESVGRSTGHLRDLPRHPVTQTDYREETWEKRKARKQRRPRRLTVTSSRPSTTSGSHPSPECPNCPSSLQPQVQSFVRFFPTRVSAALWRAPDTISRTSSSFRACGSGTRKTEELNGWMDE